MKMETVLENQILKIILNEYEVVLSVSEIDAEKKEFKTINLGTYFITLVKSANNFELIARLKRIYPELTKYRNIEVLTKTRKSVNMEIELDKILKTLEKPKGNPQ